MSHVYLLLLFQEVTLRFHLTSGINKFILVRTDGLGLNNSGLGLGLESYGLGLGLGLDYVSAC